MTYQGKSYPVDQKGFVANKAQAKRADQALVAAGFTKEPIFRYGRGEGINGTLVPGSFKYSRGPVSATIIPDPVDKGAGNYYLSVNGPRGAGNRIIITQD